MIAFIKFLTLFQKNGKKLIFFEGYELIYPRLATSLNWRFDYLFFKKKKVKNGSCLG